MKRPKVITFGAMKGGSGKSITAVNTAGCVSEESRVLLIDADPQANATTNIGIDIADLERTTISSVFDDEIDPDKVIIRGPVEELPNLDLLPSSILLFETEERIMTRAGREMILDYYLKENKGFFKKYDYIVIDTNPGMGVINQNCFYAANSIVLITDTSWNGMQGISVFNYLWDKKRKDLRKKDNVKAVVLNNYDRRLGAANDAHEYTSDDDEIGPLLVEPPIPYRVAYKDSEAGKPINIVHRNSKEHQIILELIVSLQKKGVF